MDSSASSPLLEDGAERALLIARFDGDPVDTKPEEVRFVEERELSTQSSKM